MEHVEVSQPQVAAPNEGEAHQPLGLELTESTTVEDGQSASVSTPTPSAPALDVAMTST